MSTNRRSVLPFSKVPNNAVFRVLKERDRPVPEPGLWVKVANSRSRAYSNSRQIILALGDMCEVVSTKPAVG